MTDIRSYRRVFDLERRIYSVDRLRLNPAGVPMRGVVYALAAISAFAAARHAPLVGALTVLFPWYVWEAGLPIAIASAFTVLRIDGRRFHVALAAIVRHALGPRQFVALKPGRATGRVWRPGDFLLVPDGSEGRIRRMRFSGPGAVFVACAHERREGSSTRMRAGVRFRRSSTLLVRELAEGAAPDRVEVLALSAGATLLVAPPAGRYG
jgi:hypothetical protein